MHANCAGSCAIRNTAVQSRWVDALAQSNPRHPREGSRAALPLPTLKRVSPWPGLPGTRKTRPPDTTAQSPYQKPGTAAEHRPATPGKSPDPTCQLRRHVRVSLDWGAHPRPQYEIVFFVPMATEIGRAHV